MAILLSILLDNSYVFLGPIVTWPYLKGNMYFNQMAENIRTQKSLRNLNCSGALQKEVNDLILKVLKNFLFLSFSLSQTLEVIDFISFPKCFFF